MLQRSRERRALKEFSKKCLSAMIILWFIGALFGFAVVAVQIIRGDMVVSLAEVLAYIGAPMTGGIVSYMIKSAWEKRKTNSENKEENSYEII